ncbi:helix-turn-helix domain-containing protein [Mitsuokella jalaludinii]|uniref:helix-turn-helix domain-containing protein n=1 Tax=Mitsuokella jalaludinii TaxID=187979 RepID=UPI00307DFBB7
MESAAIEMMIVNAIERTGRAMAQHMGERQTPDELLTVKEVAKILKVSLNYANHLVQSGIIPGLKMNGMKVRRRALEAWMAAMEGQDLSDPAQPVPIRRPSKSA